MTTNVTKLPENHYKIHAYLCFYKLPTLVCMYVSILNYRFKKKWQTLFVFNSTHTNFGNQNLSSKLLPCLPLIIYLYVCTYTYCVFCQKKKKNKINRYFLLAKFLSFPASPIALASPLDCLLVYSLVGFCLSVRWAVLPLRMQNAGQSN